MRDRSLKRIPISHLYDEPRYLNRTDGTEVDITPYFQYMLIADPVTRTAPQILSGNALRVDTISKPRPTVQTVTPGTNADAAHTITETRVELIEIFAAMNCAVAVADRAFTVFIQKASPIVIAGAEQSFVSTAVSLQSDENGSIFVPEGGNHVFVNDNGTPGVNANENPLPCTLETTAIVGCQATNKNADDRMSLRIKYRILEA